MAYPNSFIVTYKPKLILVEIDASNSTAAWASSKITFQSVSSFKAAVLGSTCSDSSKDIMYGTIEGISTTLFNRIPSKAYLSFGQKGTTEVKFGFEYEDVFKNVKVSADIPVSTNGSCISIPTRTDFTLLFASNQVPVTIRMTAAKYDKCYDTWALSGASQGPLRIADIDIVNFTIDATGNKPATPKEGAAYHLFCYFIHLILTLKDTTLRVWWLALLKRTELCKDPFA